MKFKLLTLTSGILAMGIAIQASASNNNSPEDEIGEMPMTSRLRCSLPLEENAAQPEFSVIDVNGASFDRQNPFRSVSVRVHHGVAQEHLNQTNPAGRDEFILPNKGMDLANVISNVHETKIMIVDPTIGDEKDKTGKVVRPAQDRNIVFKLKVKYTSENKYDGSLFYSMNVPGKKDLAQAGGPVSCFCVNRNNAEVACPIPPGVKVKAAKSKTATAVAPPVEVEPVTPEALAPSTNKGAAPDRNAINLSLTHKNYLDIDTTQNASPSANERAPGVAYFRAVMKGVLYRGGSGIRGPLNDTQLHMLCEEGFSGATFGYAGGNLPMPVTCQTTDGKPNEFTYMRANGSFGPAHAFLTTVSNAIKDNKGPVLVHCWYGQHESGELATYALQLFCGYNVAQATTYWETHANGSDAPQFDPVRSSIATFGSIVTAQLNKQATPGKPDFASLVEGIDPSVLKDVCPTP